MLHRVLSHTKLQLIMHMHAWTEIINNCPEPGAHITERASNSIHGCGNHCFPNTALPYKKSV